MQVLIPIQPLADVSAPASPSLARMCLDTIDQQPWIEYVLDRLPRRYAETATFILPEACRRLYYFDELIHQLLPQSQVVVTPDGVRGALCMVMYACDAAKDGELCILSGNQALHADWEQLFDDLRSPGNDAALVTMEATHPRWPHVRVTEEGQVMEASEVHLLSRQAIAGVYYFRSRRAFFACAEEVIRKGNAVEGNFGLPGTINELVLRNKFVRAVPVDASSLTAIATSADCAALA